MGKTTEDSAESKQQLSEGQLLLLLLKSVKSLGINVDIVILDIILQLRKEILISGDQINLKDIEIISQSVVEKYKQTK